jgi:hypothetical protein
MRSRDHARAPNRYFFAPHSLYFPLTSMLLLVTAPGRGRRLEVSPPGREGVGLVLLYLEADEVLHRFEQAQPKLGPHAKGNAKFTTLLCLALVSCVSAWLSDSCGKPAMSGICSWWQSHHYAGAAQATSSSGAADSHHVLVRGSRRTWLGIQRRKRRALHHVPPFLIPWLSLPALLLATANVLDLQTRTERSSVQANRTTSSSTNYCSFASGERKCS